MHESALDYLRARMSATGSAIYLGEGHAGWVTPGPQRNALVLGPPRSYKSSAVVVPTVLAAPAAAVSTSSKPDILESTAAARSRVGTCWILDLSGTASRPGLSELRWSPVVGAESWDEAVVATHSMVRTARPSLRGPEETHWTERAQALLAPLLHAAALDGSDIDAVVKWVNTRDETTALRILTTNGSELAKDQLGGIASTDERERSGIFSTTSGVLSAYRSSAAMKAGCRPNFDPRAFVNSCDTVYVCAPATYQEALAPVAVTFLEALRRALPTRTSPWPPMVWALDELANIAPLPSLPAVVSEGGGQGLVTLGCLQDLSQARARWGAAADGFWSLFSSTLVMPGIGDVKTLASVSALAGDHDVPVPSRTRGRWPPSNWRSTVTTSQSRRPRLPPDRIAHGHTGHALLVQPAAEPTWVRLTPWYTTSPWREAVLESPGGIRRP